MPALDWITIKGFKSIASLEKLRLRPINVLIGANGSGKSNFLEAFSFLQTLQSRGLRNYVMRAGGADKILHFGSKETPSATFHVSFEDEINQYEIELTADDDDGLFPSREVAYYWNKKGYPHPYPDPFRGRDREAGIGEQASPVARYVNSHLDRWRLYHFHDTGPKSPMKKISDVNDNRDLRTDGSNLASFLYRLREDHAGSYDLIRRTVRLVAPFFDDFALEPLAANEDKIRLEWKHRGTDAWFNAASLSDGSLRFIALTTLLLQPEELRPSVVLLDEPELGLHPYAITLLASLVQQASVKTQVILATQSPILLDRFEPEDVLVADRKDGRTEFNRLRRKRLKKWLRRYSLGQLWEKNEFGGRPSFEHGTRAG